MHIFYLNQLSEIKHTFAELLLNLAIILLAYSSKRTTGGTASLGQWWNSEQRLQNEIWQFKQP